MFVFVNEPYSDLLERCKYDTFPDSVNAEGADFYLGDASGNRIGDDSLVIVGDDGGKKTIPWSLSDYFQIRGVKYPSKVKFTCMCVEVAT